MLHRARADACASGHGALSGSTAWRHSDIVPGVAPERPCATSFQHLEEVAAIEPTLAGGVESSAERETRVGELSRRRSLSRAGGDPRSRSRPAQPLTGRGARLARCEWAAAAVRPQNRSAAPQCGFVQAALRFACTALRFVKAAVRFSLSALRTPTFRTAVGPNRTEKRVGSHSPGEYGLPQPHSGWPLRARHLRDPVTRGAAPS